VLLRGQHRAVELPLTADLASRTSTESSAGGRDGISVRKEWLGRQMTILKIKREVGSLIRDGRSP